MSTINYSWFSRVRGSPPENIGASGQRLTRPFEAIRPAPEHPPPDRQAPTPINTGPAEGARKTSTVEAVQGSRANLTPTSEAPNAARDQFCADRETTRAHHADAAATSDDGAWLEEGGRRERSHPAEGCANGLNAASRRKAGSQ